MAPHTAAPAPSRPPVMLWTGLALLAIYVVLGLLIRLDPSAPFSQPLDDWWRALVGVGPDNPAYQWWLPMIFQFFGELGQLIIPLAVIGLLLALRRWRSAVFVLAASVATTLLSQGMKHFVNRPRPADDLAAGLFGPLFSVDHGSFPSGHCVTVATFAIAYAALIPASPTLWRRLWSVVAALLMIGIVWQRTLINAHWVTDACAGLIAGAGGSLLLIWAFWPWLVRDHLRSAVADGDQDRPSSLDAEPAGV